MNNPAAASCLLILLAATACESKKSAPTSHSAQATVTPEAAPIKVTEPPRPAPADIVVEPLQKDLKCDKKAKSDSCRILNDFVQGSRWSAQTPSGEGRWIGNAFVREKGSEKKQLLLLWAKSVPTSQVGPGDLPVRIGTGTLPDDATEHGFKMISAISQGDTPSKHNQARPLVESFVPTVHRGAVNTAGPSVRLISDEAVYLRQSGRRVVVVMPNQAQNAAPGDGTYAELWRATW